MSVPLSARSLPIAGTPNAVSGGVIAAVTAAHPKAPPAHSLTLGVYAGPDSKGVAGAARFGALTGVQPGGVLDFGATDRWSNIAAPSWLIAPHAASTARFEYSMPMLPDGTHYTLAACAAGAYNAYWRAAATNLVAHQLPNTIVRPGWEFNGSWYHWAAKDNITGYVGCFRTIVTTMRSVAGQHFAFDWNPTLGAGAFPAQLAYPGDAYVDYIGVDIYDSSWSRYPTAATGLAAAQAAAWNDDVNGADGLAFWSAFARSHAKPMAITEWGLVAMTNGHGGGDDPAFVDHMFDFMTDPANNVAYEHYFNTGSAADDHTLTGATKFPKSVTEYRRRVLALTAH
ncbi:MAG TPA: glycosyl hydrolase [Acidothermaceae bacterium]|nr:glycosyl hydrolase [Acidothermaceae bacterium]